MRILYLCHRLPYPPDKGEKIRAFYELQALGREHAVDLFTLAHSDTELGLRSPLLKHCRTVTVAEIKPFESRLRALPYLLTDAPLTVPCFRSATLLRETRNALAKRSYDRIFIYSSTMAQYVEGVTGLPVIVDLVDVDSDKWRQYAASTSAPLSLVYRREALCLRNFERRLCELADCVVVTTAREASLVREISPPANVRVVANGVNTDYFQPPRVEAHDRPPVVIFTGDMSYFPNQEATEYFARTVFPLVRAAVDTARFVVVGRNPGRAVRRLARIPGVTVTGFVPDVRTYFAKAVVAVAPFLIAAGIQNKILEAMASGLPVAGTSRAVQGLTPDVAGMVEIGDSPEELAGKIVTLLRNPQMAARKGRAGRERLAADYDWDKNLGGLLHLVREPRGASDIRRAALDRDALSGAVGSGIAFGQLPESSE